MNISDSSLLKDGDVSVALIPIFAVDNFMPDIHEWVEKSSEALDGEFSPEDIESSLSNGELRLAIVLDGGEPVGFMGLSVRQSSKGHYLDITFAGGKEGEIFNGVRSIKLVIERAFKDGFIGVKTNASGKAARTLYKRLKFKEQAVEMVLMNEKEN